MIRNEQGSATVQAVCVAALLALVAVTCLQAAVVIGLRQRAGTAADQAALAASRASVEGGDPCEVARQIAGLNGGDLRECRMDADVATVRVRVAGARWSFGRWAAEKRARAAPTWYLR